MDDDRHQDARSIIIIMMIASWCLVCVRRYPLDTGHVECVGEGAGTGYNLNIPLPPGSGWGAYKAAFRRVVLPALAAYKPDLILVS